MNPENYEQEMEYPMPDEEFYGMLPEMDIDPMDFLDDVIVEYMDFVIGIKRDNTLNQKIKSDIMASMAQAISSLVSSRNLNNQQNNQLSQQEEKHQQSLVQKQEAHEMKMAQKVQEAQLKQLQKQGSDYSE